MTGDSRGEQPITASAGAIMARIRDGSAWTRAELSRATGLSRNSLGQWVDTFTAAGLVAPVGRASSTGGRRASQFAFHAAGRSLVAIDVGATHVRVACADLAGRVVAEQYLAIAVTEGPDAVLTRVREVATHLLPALDAPLAGVGIGLPGPVQFDAGWTVNPPIMPGWDRVDVRERLRADFGVPAVVDNDVNAMALGERASAAPPMDDLIFIKVATGIGAGIISGGRLYRGATGAAGDIGHAPVARREDVQCVCGNHGCLEAVASGRALLRRLSDEGMDLGDLNGLVAAVKSGDGRAVQAVRQAGRDIGEVLAVAVPLLNPRAIVIGGSMARVAEHLIAGVREVVYARSIPLSTEGLAVVASRAAQDAAIRGIAALVCDQILSAEGIEATLRRPA